MIFEHGLPPDTLSRRRFLLGSALAAAAAAAGAGGLSGCAAGGGGGGSSSSSAAKSKSNPFGVDSSAPLEMVIFDGGFGSDYAKHFETLYSKEFPDAKLSMTATQQITGVLQPRFNAGNPPDLVDDSGAQQIKLDVLYGNGQLADLGPLLDAPSVDDPNTKVRDTLMPGTVAAGTYGNSMYDLQYVYTAFGLWYSKSLFAKHGWTVPTTWDDWIKQAAEIKAAGIAPFAFQGKYPYYMLVPIMDLAAKHGGVETLVAVDNLEPNAWKSDPVKQAVEAIYEIVARNYYLPGTQGMTHIQSQTAWNNGRAAWIPCGSWLENEQLKATPAGFDMAFAPMPSLSGDKLPQTAIRAGANEPFIVPAKARNVPGGMEMMRLMLSKAGSVAFAQVAHSLTVVKNAVGPNVQLLPGTRSANAAVQTSGASTFYWYYPSWYAQLETDLENATGELMAGRMKPADWMNACQAAADKTAKDSSIKKFKRSASLI
ncbi:N-acetylglucosamine/diacetylchitobiose ABC transporter substrate-binding protein [Phaeacidiphilus oryzae]|uniref:N-acetylglucosamine/diacetylchitobiose ABC transporter substrate-binding protein n=1 Tax=Phaeacidiphilus oryzae TaxID=348818 RepID=UPI000A572F8F|nr:N-acetylglucosamine/diacetylchitobiose ABC transporter substrate-binding protein [Phaeacidiphilus oryzae]